MRLIQFGSEKEAFLLSEKVREIFCNIVVRWSYDINF
jgi:hypothetical protein